MNVEYALECYLNRICICTVDGKRNLDSSLLEARKGALKELRATNLKNHEIMFQLTKFRERAKKDGII